MVLFACLLGCDADSTEAGDAAPTTDPTTDLAAPLDATPDAAPDATTDAEAPPDARPDRNEHSFDADLTPQDALPDRNEHSFRDADVAPPDAAPIADAAPDGNERSFDADVAPPPDADPQDDARVAPDAGPDAVPDVIEPDVMAPDEGVAPDMGAPGLGCPPAVEWSRDEVLWVFAGGRVVGLSTRRLYAGEPIDPETDVVAAFDDADLPGTLHPDGLRALALNGDGFLREAYLPSRRWSGPLGARITGAGHRARFLRPGADGERLVVGLDAVVDGQPDRVARVDTRTGRREDFDPRQPGVQDLVVADLRGVASTRDGRLVYTDSGEVYVADPAPRAVYDHEHGIPARPLAVSGERAYVGVGGQVVPIDLSGPVRAAEPHGEVEDGPVVELYADPAGGRYFLVRRIRGEAWIESGLDCCGAVWRTFSAPVPAGSAEQRLALTADGAFLIHQVLGDRAIRVFDPRGGRLLHTIEFGARIDELLLRGPGDDAERCTGLDDDCDGFVDEGYETGAECGGRGACGPGMRECADRERTRCSTEPGGSDDASRPEVCNGEDDDCDGVSDEDPPFVAHRPVALTDSPSGKAEPRLVPTAEGFAVVWTDNRDEDPDVMFLRFDPQGRPLGEPVPVAADPQISETRPLLAWSGEAFGVATTALVRNISTVTFHPLDARGMPLEPMAFERPENAWTGGLVWTAGRYALTAFTSDAMGTRRVETTFLTAAGELLDTLGVDAPALRDVATVDSRGSVGTVYVHGPDDEVESGLQLVNFPLAGRATWSPLVRGAPVESTRPAVAFSTVSNEYATFHWTTEMRRNLLRVVTFGAGRVQHDADVVRTAHPQSPPSAVWATTEFGVVWVDSRDDRVSVWFQRLDARGALVGEPLPIAGGAEAPRSPTLVWTGETYGLVYVERDGPIDQLHFVHGPMGCPLVRE